MATAEEKICSKCEKEPAQKGDAWCKECRSKYKADYDKSKEWRAERRGIIRGIRAMREYLSAHFRTQGRAYMGPEVGATIETMPGPAVADEDAKAE